MTSTVVTLCLLCILGGGAILLSPFLRRESAVVRYAILTFSLVASVRYIYWRATSTLPPVELSAICIFSYGFLGFELVAMYLGRTTIRNLSSTANRSKQADQQLDWYGRDAPRVDVLIATYNERWEVLEKTVVGALSQNYLNYHVWLLDDGNRPWPREQGVQLEFIAVLDADFVARPEFIRRTLAVLKDGSLGIVQTPQCFYNPDPHQVAFGGVKNWPDEQRSWFDGYLPSFDAQGWATCCGTSCMIRMAALDAIGGFPTQSVCEDTLASMKMWKAGFKTGYLHEALTVGLAPEGMVEFLTQRARWLVGGVQNTRVMGPRAGIRNRILYWLSLWKMLVFGLVPFAWMGISIIYWFTGVFLIASPSWGETVSYFGPLWLDRFFIGWLLAGTRMPVVSEALQILLSPLWIVETFRAVVGSKARFKVTDKAVRKDKTVVHWRLVRYQLCTVGLLLAGFAYNMVSPSAPAYYAGFFQANTALTILFVFFTYAGIAPAIEPPKRRSAERYAADEPVEAIVNGRPVSWRCVELSLSGALIKADGTPLPDRVDLRLADSDTSIRCRLVRTTPTGEAAYAFESPGVRAELIRRLYCSDRYIPAPKRWSLTRAVSAPVVNMIDNCTIAIVAATRIVVRLFSSARVDAERVPVGVEVEVENG
jgi:cellulose synthase (UDP-forming)